MNNNLFDREMNMTETVDKEQGKMTVSSVIPKVGDTEADEVIGEKVVGNSTETKPTIFVTEFELFRKLQKTCRTERYFFVGGFFRTVPKMNKTPVGTAPADRKNAKHNPFLGKVVKFSRSVGRNNFDWGVVKGNAEEKAGLERSEIKERMWGTKIGDTPTVAHTLKGTDKTRGYIPYNPQKVFESYYVWTETGKRLTEDEVKELKTYVREYEDGPAIYRDYRTNTVLWMNTGGKHLVVKNQPNDKDFLSNAIAESEEVERQKKESAKAKKGPSLR